MEMTAPAPVIIGIRRHNASAPHKNQHSTENIRYLRPNRWRVGVHRFSVCQTLQGDGKIELFHTSPRTPIQIPFGDETALRNEVELRHSLLNPGLYPVVEMELLWFASEVMLVDWEVAGGRPVVVGLKVMTSSSPNLDARRGDLLVCLGGRDYWLSQDWRTLWPKRPAKPLSAILIPEKPPLNSSNKLLTSQLLPGERFRVRFRLSTPIVVNERNASLQRSLSG